MSRLTKRKQKKAEAAAEKERLAQITADKLYTGPGTYQWEQRKQSETIPYMKPIDAKPIDTSKNNFKFDKDSDYAMYNKYDPTNKLFTSKADWEENRQLALEQSGNAPRTVQSVEYPDIKIDATLPKDPGVTSSANFGTEVKGGKNLTTSEPTARDRVIANSIARGMSAADAEARTSGDFADQDFAKALELNPNYTLPGTYKTKEEVGKGHTTHTKVPGGGTMHTGGDVGVRNVYETGKNALQTRENKNIQSTVNRTTLKDASTSSGGSALETQFKKSDDQGFTTEKKVTDKIKDATDTSPDKTAGGSENVEESPLNDADKAAAIKAGLDAYGKTGIYKPADPGEATSGALAREASYTPGKSGVTTTPTSTSGGVKTKTKAEKDQEDRDKLFRKNNNTA